MVLELVIIMTGFIVIRSSDMAGVVASSFDCDLLTGSSYPWFFGVTEDLRV